MKDILTTITERVSGTLAHRNVNKIEEITEASVITVDKAMKQLE